MIETMVSRPLLALLHLCDSLFPIGSFGYSDGLEAATAAGLVETPADLQEWLDVCLDEAKMVVVVVERPEPVFLIEPHAPQEWGLFAYHIGNRHLPLMITETGIVCPDVAGVEPLLEQQRIPFSRATLAFTPVTTVSNHHD